MISLLFVFRSSQSLIKSRHRCTCNCLEKMFLLALLKVVIAPKGRKTKKKKKKKLIGLHQRRTHTRNKFRSQTDNKITNK
jgi:hypothetical protein